MVTVLIRPAITVQPVGGEVVEGDPLTLSVTATGIPVPSYLWYKDDQLLAGETAAVFSRAAMTAADAGLYRVVVTNAVGIETSDEAVVTYAPAIRVLLDGISVVDTLRTLIPVSLELLFGKPDWELFYTLDGSEPTFAATPYSGPFQVSLPAVLKTVAYSQDFSEQRLGRPVQIVFLQQQSISFDPMPVLRYGDSGELNVTAISGLPVTVTVQSGPAQLTGNQLSATGSGEVVLRAVQTGNDTYAPVSAERALTIGKALQTLTWPQLPNRTFGDPAFGVAVTSSSGLPVTLSVASGKASVTGTTVTLTGAGPVSLLAEQSGDVNREAISEIRSFTVAKSEQTLTFPAIANRAFTPESFTPAGAATSGLPLQLSVLSGPATIVDGRVQLTGVGTVVIRARQPGNDDWNATLPAERSFTVTVATQSLTFANVGSRTFGDPPVTLSAASSAGLTPVEFAVVNGPATLAGNQLTITGAGTVVVRATQAGDQRYQAALAEQSIQVAKAGQSVSLAAIADQGYSTNLVSLVASASSGLTVGFRVIGGPATVTGSQLSLTGVGTISVAADQSGNANYLAAVSVTNQFVVSRGTQMITFTPLGDQILGNPPLTLQASSSAGLPVVFSVLDGPATLNGAVLSLLGEGTVTVRARQPGSPLYLAAQADQTFAVRNLATLTLVQGVGGTIAVDPAKELYPPTDTVTLTATAAEGFEFAGWSGDLGGSQNPTTLGMSANRTIGATFRDIAPPVIVLQAPSAGTTSDQAIQLAGSVTDNAAVTQARWERDGQRMADLVLSAGRFQVTGLMLKRGENRFRVVGGDAAGNEGSAEVVVTWQPTRTLWVSSPSEVQEGKTVTVPVELESPGDVGGMNFLLRYDTNYLKSPVFAWSGELGSAFTQVNIDVAGEIRAEFALPAVALPTGTSAVASVTFRARSVPFNLDTPIEVEILNMANAQGLPISGSIDALSGLVRVLKRRITGDNNANQRLDVGDASVIQRLATGLDPLRTWDVPGNDLNQSSTLDVGDTILVLRTVVGLDPQPQALALIQELALELGAGDPVELTLGHLGAGDPRLVLQPDQKLIKSGQTVTVRVVLQGMTAVFGASFHLDYPTNALWLKNAQAHRVGALVPGTAVALWNVAPAQNNYAVQNGHVSMAVSGATAWPSSNGVLAELAFDVLANVEQQIEWPLHLSMAEVATEGFDIRSLADLTLLLWSTEIQPVPADFDLGATGPTPEGFELSFQGQPGGTYVLEAAEQIQGPWSDISSPLTSPTGRFEYLDSAATPGRYYRARWVAP
ncbi:MAG: cohesin domain-containing protein [Limisphaerales bacterium]